MLKTTILMLATAGSAANPASAAGFTLDSGSVMTMRYGDGFTETGIIMYSIGFGDNGLNYTSGPGGIAHVHLQVLDNGVTLGIDTLQANWPGYGTSSSVRVYAVLRFTPTVPNLSYRFNGFMQVVESGSPISTSSLCAVRLNTVSAFGEILYENNHTYSGPCSLWQPAAPTWGTQTGPLTMGQQHMLQWHFRLDLTHGGDPSAEVQVKLKNDPSFQLLLYQRPCAGDLNGDGFVDDSDFVVFAAAYDLLLCSDPNMPPGCPADLNGDGVVDDTDFVLFASAYNQLLCP